MATHCLQFLLHPAPVLKHCADCLPELKADIVAMKLGILCPGQQVVDAMAKLCKI
jgi:hypothetical protein